MAQQNINAGDTGAEARAKINANATELYNATGALNSSVAALESASSTMASDIADLETTTSALNSIVANLDANTQKIGEPVNLVATNPTAPSGAAIIQQLWQLVWTSFQTISKQINDKENEQCLNFPSGSTVRTIRPVFSTMPRAFRQAGRIIRRRSLSLSILHQSRDASRRSRSTISD
jgi:hypothetical protein